MEIIVLNHIVLENIPSGSGIAKLGDVYYVVGDDAPFLFTLNKDFKVISRTPVLGSSNFSDQRIIKSDKPDFEALEVIDENELVIFGSGSKSPQRDVFIRILLNDSMRVERFKISKFYDQLRSLPKLIDSELNIEASAFCNNQIYLFNRKKNLIIKFNYPDLLAHLKGETAFPNPEITEFSLPKINGIEAGFSGATTLKNVSKIIFTASVEATDNAYDDGEILGSFLGIIDISNDAVSNVFDYCSVPNAVDKLKVESITVDEEISAGKTKIILITDDDQGNSTIIESMLLW